MKFFALRLAFSFYVFTLRVSADTYRDRVRRFCAKHFSIWLWQWDVFNERLDEMIQRIRVRKFFGFVFLVWLYCVLFAYQNGGILAGVYLFSVGASPVIAAVWLVTHKPTEG